MFVRERGGTMRWHVASSLHPAQRPGRAPHAPDLKLAISAALIAPAPARQPRRRCAAPDTPTSAVTVKLFNEVYDQVKSNYVEPVTDKQLVEGAIKGMLAVARPAFELHGRQGISAR